ncbi:MAG TPA: tetratricopeptide repeat protein, partial [Gemmataceae bacterium]|nr:tetratricopeptide repeat protein [Gemmataceae bacterium]
DLWRDRFRQAFERRDGSALQGLARQPEVLAQPPATVHLLALMLRQTGQTPVAVAVLRQAQRRYPDDFWVNHELGYALLRLDPVQAGEAAGCFRAALALRPESAGVRLNLGSALTQLGNFAEAEAEYREVLHSRPDSARARAGLGGVLHKQGQWARAEAEFREALRLEPGYAGAHSQLGYALLRQNKLPQAEAEFREAVRLNPDYLGYRNALGMVLSNQGKLPQAEAELREAVRRQPDSAAAHYHLAGALRKQNRPAEAEAELREAARRQPDYTPAYVGLGHLLWDQGRLDEAQAAYREATRAKPDYADAYHNLASTCARRGQWVQAAVAFERCRELKPDDYRYWYRCAILRLQTGDGEGYRRACREMLGRFGQIDQAELAARAAAICALDPDAVGDPEGVVRLADRAVTTGKKHRHYPYFLLVRGLAEYRAGRPAAAADWLQRLSPQAKPQQFAHLDAMTFAALALVHHRLGRDAEARAAAATARAIVADKMPDPGKGQPFGDDWIEWLHCQHLCREAEGLGR